MKYQWFLALLILVSCGPPKLDTSKPDYYEQDFSEPVAWLAAEWNSTKLEIVASGGLIDKENGIIITAKHFTDELEGLGSDTCKVFMNGKVYTAFIIRVPPLRDAALLKLMEFDPNELPDPYPISETGVLEGDTLFIRGFHPHQKLLIQQNHDKDFPDHPVPIVERYYKNFGRLIKHQISEIVYDNILSIVQETDALIELSDEDTDIFARAKNESNTYIRVQTERDHKISFGGLSGGIVVNEDNEIVGVITAEQEGFEKIPFDGPFVLVKRVYRTISVTPIWDLQELLDFAKYQ